MNWPLCRLTIRLKVVVSFSAPYCISTDGTGLQLYPPNYFSERILVLRSTNFVSNIYKTYTTWKQNSTGKKNVLAKREKSEKREGIGRKLVGEGRQWGRKRKVGRD